MSSVFKIVKLSQKKEAIEKSSYFPTEKIRKRVFVNALGCLALKEYLDENNFKVDEGESYSDNFHLAELLDIADLKIDSLRIDCRCIVDSVYKELWIPKKTYEFGYLFDFYVALRIETNTNRVEILGYITQDQFNESYKTVKQNSNYFIFDTSILKPISSFSEAIFNGLNLLKDPKVFEENDHNIVNENLPAFFDNELSDEERLLFQKHLVDCNQCKEDLIYFYLLNNKLKQIPDLNSLIVQETEAIKTTEEIIPEFTQALTYEQDMEEFKLETDQEIVFNQEEEIETDDVLQISQEDLLTQDISQFDMSEFRIQKNQEISKDDDLEISYIDYDVEIGDSGNIDVSELKTNKDLETDSIDNIQISFEDTEQNLDMDEDQDIEIIADLEEYEDFINLSPSDVEENQTEDYEEDNWNEENLDLDDVMTSDDSIYEHNAYLGINSSVDEINQIETFKTENSTEAQQEVKYTENIPTKKLEQVFEQSEITKPTEIPPIQDSRVPDIKDNIQSKEVLPEYKADDFIPTDSEIANLEEFVKSKKESISKGTRKKKKFSLVPLLLVASIAAISGVLVFKGQAIMPQLTSAKDNLNKYIAMGMKAVNLKKEQPPVQRELAKAQPSEASSQEESPGISDNIDLTEFDKISNNIGEKKSEVAPGKQAPEKNEETQKIETVKERKQLRLPGVSEKETEQANITKNKPEQKLKKEVIKEQKPVTKSSAEKETAKKPAQQINKKEAALLASNLPSAAPAMPKSVINPNTKPLGELKSKHNEATKVLNKEKGMSTQRAREMPVKIAENYADKSFVAGGASGAGGKHDRKNVSLNDNLLASLSEKKESIKVGLSKTDTAASHKFTPVNVSWRPSTNQQIDSNLRNFINSAAQNTKSALNNDLKDNEIPTLNRSTVVIVKINNSKKSVTPQISVSSGSSRVDNIILKSVKKGFSNSSLPKDGTPSEPIEINVTVAQ